MYELINLCPVKSLSIVLILSKLAAKYIPVICYGLKTNFKTELFEGSKRLLELSDSITELKSICKCGHKAIINARIVNGKVVTDGTEIVIGGDETYEAMCYSCFKKQREQN